MVKHIKKTFYQFKARRARQAQMKQDIRAFYEASQARQFLKHAKHAIL